MHLRCAAQRVPAELRRALRAFPCEVPGLADVLLGTDVVRELPPPVFADEDLPDGADEALAIWRAEDPGPLAGPDDVERWLAALARPLPAPRTWRQRYLAWTAALKDERPEACAAVLRSIALMRIRMSYSERRILERATAVLAAALGRVDPDHAAAMPERIRAALDRGVPDADA